MGWNANANQIAIFEHMKNTIIMSICAVLLSACSSTQSTHAESVAAETMARVEAIKAQAGIAPPADKTKATTKVNKPYFGSKSVPLRSKVVLPEKFKQRFEFRYPNVSLTLPQALERVSAITGIPTRIASDVPAKDPERRPVLLDAAATAESMFDQIARDQGLNWEIKDGVVVYQKFVTKSFTLMVQPGNQVFDFTLGKNGRSEAAAGGAGTGGSISTGFTSQASARKEATMKPLQSTIDAISKVLTKDGKVVGSEASGSIVVIDTPDAVDRAEKIVQRENEILTRQAVFHVEVISFRANDDVQAGIDWQIVFNNLNKLGATMTSPKSLANSVGGNIGIQLLSGTGSVGRFDGTKAFLSLLNEYGTTTTVYKNDIRTRNRSTTTVQSLAQTVYIARTTPAPASATGQVGGTPGIEPGTVTAGVDLKMQPFIFDSNQISLLFNIGIVDLADIVPLNSGGENPVTIEGPETKGFEFQEETFLTPGVTTLITGYERVLEAYTRRKLGRDVPMALGGSMKGESQKERLFILITPTVVGSAY